MSHTYSNRYIESDREVKRLEREVEEANTIFFELSEQIRQKEAQRFVKVGGCKSCGGRGFVVTWDTLDSLSGCYAEYGPCDNPECTDTSRQSTGLDRSYYSRYDRNRGIPHHEPDISAQIMLHPITELITYKRDELQHRRDNLRPDVKGRMAKVVGGRKVPIGTQGVVIWVGMSKGKYPGLRLGLKTEGQANPVWVAADNCLGIIPQDSCASLPVSS